MNWEIFIVRRLNLWIGSSEFYYWAVLFSAKYLLYFMLAALVVLVATRIFYTRITGMNFNLFMHAIFASVVARVLFTEIIRFFWSRPRPFEILHGLNSILSHYSGGSFPSGHASAAFAIAMAVYYYYPKTSILFFLAAISIGFGRVSAELHWPTDILGGVIVGIFSAWLIKMFLKKIRQDTN